MYMYMYVQVHARGQADRQPPT
eukprot:SAG22_NODE_14203_length_382_cov_0.643110_1_plen_21_part_10